MSRSCLSAFDSREADDPSSMAPGFYAFPFEDYDRPPVGPFPTYVEAVAAARAAEARTALPADLFTRLYADLDDVQACIGTAVAFVDERTAGKALPASLALDLACARETLATLAEIRGPKRRAKAFRDEHGIETLKDLWFAFADHAALLGLRAVAA